MSSKSNSHLLENIEEDSPASWLPVLSCAPPPETPTESMEFLARSWSLSAMELSKALSDTNDHKKPPLASLDPQVALQTSTASMETLLHPLPSGDDPPILFSQKESEDVKELFLLHQALNPDFLSSQQLLNNGLYKSILRGKTMGRWLKDQKERKKHEIRTHDARLHASISVIGVAAAVAALTTSTAASHQVSTFNTCAAIASAAALVASHCIEIAEEMGANHEQILTVVNSAISARTNGDIMTLTAGAATALRGAATLRARLHKGYGGATFTLTEEKVEEVQESEISTALNFVAQGRELLKLTRKGALHWKHVSFNINSTWQVVVKMKSKHMAGTFTKKKKYVVSGVYCDIPAWSGREREESSEQKCYFGIKTADRIIEFECKNKADKKMWTEGIQHMMQCRAKI